MSFPPGGGRNVRYDDQFEAELAALQPDLRRVEEARRYLEWVLSNHPEQGIDSEYPGVLFAPFKIPRANDTIARTSIFYIYDEEGVDVLSVKVAPAKRPQAGDG